MAGAYYWEGNRLTEKGTCHVVVVLYMIFIVGYYIFFIFIRMMKEVIIQQ